MTDKELSYVDIIEGWLDLYIKENKKEDFNKAKFIDNMARSTYEAALALLSITEAELLEGEGVGEPLEVLKK